ncbi:MAG: serine hydrolase, partial [Saprospiraceae bacterium]
MKNIIKISLLVSFLLSGKISFAQVTPEVRSKMLARAAELELKTSYNAPPGDALSHHTAGYAKIMCSAIFITGLTPEFAAENVGYFTSPYLERAKVGKPIIDYKMKTVSIKLPNGVTRTAIYTGDQGCVCLTEGSDSLYFKPVKVSRNLPDAVTTSWPIGDMLPTTDMPSNIDMTKIEQAIDSAFAPAEALTAAFVVTYKGRIIGERYADGINTNTALESWSMGKSLSATLMGILIRQGVYTLEQPAPIPQWQGKGDGRAKIRIMDIMHMSSGLYCRAPQDPDYDPSVGYPDHLYLYTGGINSFEYAANLPQQWLPNSVGRYRNCDPVLINYLNLLGIEGKGENYYTFPQKELFDKIGIRTMVMETDPYGNFLTQGYEFASARDWARLGNLYLQDGIWNGE